MSGNNNGVVELEVVLKEAEALVLVDPAKQVMVTTLTDVAGRIQQYKDDAVSRKVMNEGDANIASVILSGMATDKKAVESATKEWKEQAFRFHRRITGFCALFTDPLDESYRTLKGKVIAFQQAEQAKAEAEARRLQAIADEKARREREALEKKAANVKSEEKKQAYMEQAAAVQAPVISATVAKTAGVRIAQRWDVRLPIDEDAFFAALAKDKSLRGYVDVAVTKLARAKASNTRLEVPGVNFYQRSV